jgi:site-specific recombinase XerD
MSPSDHADDNYVFNAPQFLAPFSSVNVQRNLSILLSPETALSIQTFFSDSEIVAMWSEASTNNLGTKRTKRKEGGRLVFYCYFVLRKGLNQLDACDIENYMRFTETPQPAEKWISKTKWPRQDARWRPFAGPLSVNSQRLAILMLKNLFKWMKAMSLIVENPLMEITKFNLSSPPPEIHLLPDSAIYFVYKAIGSDRKLKKRVRNSFMITLFFTTAITPLEAEISDMNVINQKAREMTISPIGKKSRIIPISQAFLEELSLYRATFDLPINIQKNEDTPLLLTADSKCRRLSRSAMVYCISAVMKSAGALARLEGAHHLAGLLNQASAYWLRHTHLRNLAEDGSEFLSINRFAGHSNLETTKKYFDID